MEAVPDLEISAKRASIKIGEAQTEESRTMADKLRTETQWHPWQIVAAAMTAGAALFGAGVALTALWVRSGSPSP